MRRVSFALSLAVALVSLTAVPTVVAEEDPATDVQRLSAEQIVELLRSKEIARRVEGAEAAADSQEEAVEKALIDALSDDDARVRSAAIHSLGARAGAKSKRTAAKALVRRLSKLRKAGEVHEELDVIEALERLAQVESIDALLDDIDLETPSEVVEARMMAVANVPHRDAIDGLIEFLQKGRRRGRDGQPKHAAKALQAATGERFGSDPDRWREWWKGAKDSFDFVAAAERREEQREREAKREERREKRRGRE